jgi:hypothetical protein
MKEMNYEGIGATEFDLADSQNPQPHAPIYYGNKWPHRQTNNAAKIVDAPKVMGQVLQGK